MNYPTWELTTYGGGLLIAVMAIVHVLVSHFAVGGGAFLVLLEKKAYRENSDGLLAYVKAHSKFFLLLTMVFGGLTGVGIWWTIALLNPGATSSLIHIFVFGWAAEWVFFVGEIVALFIYFYTFGTMHRVHHLRIGWIYFICAWMSLFLINGIIDFMLTPGAWLEDQDFWSGFFNPTFWPSLVFRTGLSLVLCGVFGFVTGSFVRDSKLRATIMRTCSAWVAVPFILMLAGLWWYAAALPAAQQAMATGGSPEIIRYLKVLLLMLPVLFGAGIIMALRLPQGIQKLMSFGVVAIALIYFGSFEFIRESARRPYIIHGHMYSNQILVEDADKLGENGFLQTAKWVENREINDTNRIAAGHELFLHQCSVCHSVDGPLNDIKPLVAKYDSAFGMDAKLNGLGKLNTYMPPFFGNLEERWALASYIVADLNGANNLNGNNPVVDPSEPGLTIPPFDKEKDEYVLLAWNNLGMHCISDSDPYWILLPPANDLFAQLVRRGDPPELVTENVTIEYTVESGFAHPEKHVRFWEFSKELLGADLKPGIGVAGFGVNGKMQLEEDHNAFSASLVPVVPYTDDNRYNPYPLFTIVARNVESGEILATTRMVAPTSTEMGCKNCHGGGWRVDGVAGFTDATSLDVLAAHDKNSGTDLVRQAKNGKPKLCQSCHADPVLNTKGNPEVLSFPAALHGWHAAFLSDREGMQACVACHPSRPDGPTECFRSHHAENFDCTNCHGTMEDHALSLLKKEEEAGKKGAARLIAQLQARTVATTEEIKPRTPWLNEPDCLTCHEDYQMAETDSAFNTWTAGAEELYRMRHDELGALMCEACHGSTHAVYPATRNKYGKNRDSIQPLQYQGNDRPIGNDCTVCHLTQPEDEAHHPNSLRQ